ncbi:something about silencing protein 10 isoform X1 [Colletes gigas]|uniref:something about silencing protein 10 isoform X1 n=1 Tax=Colletes gigas TaxID=935657 RepID=UPI001C9AE2E6|nr:something about silencing protein 10 isoform X1 [Colletes gigas]
MKNKQRSKVTKKVEEMEDLEDINMNEVTDSEEELSETEQKLLQKVRARHSSESYDSEYEIYGLRDKDQDDIEDETEADSMESDIEGLQGDLDLPNEKAWGKNKRAYYSTDYVDPDYSTVSQKDLAEAEIEEEEAKSIQKRLAEQLDDVDFGLDFIEPQEDNKEKIYEKTEQFVKTDLSKLSKRQKQALMQRENPEFMALVNDFKDRMIEARDVLAPFLKLVKNGIIPNCPAIAFVKTKYHLLLNYCINISFYLMLKAKRSPVNSHPVIKRLAQYRQLLNQLESGQGNLIQEIQELLKAKRQGKPLYNILDGSNVNSNGKKITSSLKEKLNHLRKPAREAINNQSTKPESVSEAESNIEDNEFSVEEDLKNDISIDKDQEEGDINTGDSITESSEKRAITYQIAKNKGLTPHRKKEQRNPRVKHRNKYRKAKIRRKGAIREVRKEITRYTGEISGIKASVKKSIKLK